MFFEWKFWCYRRDTLLILSTRLKAFAFSSCQFTNYQIPFLSSSFFPFPSVFIWGHHISGNSHPEIVSSNQIGKRVSYRSRYNSQDWLINIWEWKSYHSFILFYWLPLFINVEYLKLNGTKRYKIQKQFYISHMS